MKDHPLHDRLHLLEDAEIPTRDPADTAPAVAPPPVDGIDPFADIKARVHKAVITALGPGHLADLQRDAQDVHDLVESAVIHAVDLDPQPLSRSERVLVRAEVMDEVLGYGPINRYLKDDTITEIMVNGPEDVWIERDGMLQLGHARFVDADHIHRIIDKIVTSVGRHIDEASPMVDARLPDGSRVNAVIPPLSLRGPVLTVRKFHRTPLTLDDLVRLNTLSQPAADFLAACVLGKANILISGGTGSGKTTLLDALSASIPAGERIVTIEDSAELQLSQRHVIPLESRPSNIEGRGSITIRDLVRNSLRMRPDRIIVGEVRGSEAVDMLQAMNTGHEGSMSTIHANSPDDALDRIELLVLTSDVELPAAAIQRRIARALDIVVQIGRTVDGERRVTSIVEVAGSSDDGHIATTPIFTLNESNERVVETSQLAATGYTPVICERLERRAAHVDAAWFTTRLA